MKTEIFGVEDVMLIQQEKMKKDKRIYKKSVGRRLYKRPNNIKRIHSFTGERNK